jgi:muramoyltetrapeptide carboxypeptidase
VRFLNIYLIIGVILLIIPHPVRSGARIGIVAPASPCDPGLTHQAIEQLCAAGYEPVLGASVFRQHGFLAGTDEERLYDLHQMFADRSVEAILCLRGGYGSVRIVEYLDYDLIRANPKWLIGYSDITTLLLAIYQRTGLLTLHGPMLAELPASGNAKGWTNLWKRLKKPSMPFIYPPTEKAHCLFPGETAGPLIGGNLTLLVATLGTPFEIDTVGHILFIEEVGENPYRIDRMLTQLRLSGKLQATKGIILGSFKDCKTPPDQSSIPIIDVFRDQLSTLCIPAYIGFPAGHALPNYAFPIGAPASMNADTCTCKVFPSGYPTKS